MEYKRSPTLLGVQPGLYEEIFLPRARSPKDWGGLASTTKTCTQIVSGLKTAVECEGNTGALWNALGKELNWNIQAFGFKVGHQSQAGQDEGQHNGLDRLNFWSVMAGAVETDRD